MRKSILIVDDEESIRKSLGAILTDEGYEVLLAESGEQALKILDEESATLVLLDIWLPGMDGIEVLKRIKTDYPNVMVIMMSGTGTIEPPVKGPLKPWGALLIFIEKPIVAREGDPARGSRPRYGTLGRGKPLAQAKSINQPMNLPETVRVSENLKKRSVSSPLPTPGCSFSERTAQGKSLSPVHSIAKVGVLTNLLSKLIVPPSPTTSLKANYSVMRKGHLQVQRNRNGGNSTRPTKAPFSGRSSGYESQSASEDPSHSSGKSLSVSVATG